MLHHYCTKRGMPTWNVASARRCVNYEKNLLNVKEKERPAWQLLQHYFPTYGALVSMLQTPSNERCCALPATISPSHRLNDYGGMEIEFTPELTISIFLLMELFGQTVAKRKYKHHARTSFQSCDFSTNITKSIQQNA